MENDIVEIYVDWDGDYRIFMYVPASGQVFELDITEKDIGKLPEGCEFAGQINFTVLRNRKLEKRKQQQKI